MPVSVKVGGAWKTATNVYNKVGGVWKTAADMPVKVGGVWKTGILIQGAYESIATFTGNGTASSYTFSSIPQTYKSLQLRIFGSSSAAGTDFRHTNIRFNSDSGSNYVKHSISTEGTTVYALSGTSQTSINTGFGYIPGSSLNSSGAGIIDIIDYFNTSKNKTVRMFAGSDGNGSGNLNLASGLWINTSAINAITLTLSTGNFASGSILALYGIRG